MSNVVTETLRHLQTESLWAAGLNSTRLESKQSVDTGTQLLRPVEASLYGGVYSLLNLVIK